MDNSWGRVASRVAIFGNDVKVPSDAGSVCSVIFVVFVTCSRSLAGIIATDCRGRETFRMGASFLNLVPGVT